MVATGLLVLGLAQANQLVLAVTVPVFALAVPALVVSRVPVTPPASPRRPRLGLAAVRGPGLAAVRVRPAAPAARPRRQAGVTAWNP